MWVSERIICLNLKIFRQFPAWQQRRAVGTPASAQCPVVFLYFRRATFPDRWSTFRTCIVRLWRLSNSYRSVRTMAEIWGEFSRLPPAHLKTRPVSCPAFVRAIRVLRSCRWVSTKCSKSQRFRMRRRGRGVVSCSNCRFWAVYCI